jgi:hypothetical protein
MQPGWYPDQGGAPIERYWDGSSWTGHSRPAQLPGAQPFTGSPNPTAPLPQTGGGWGTSPSGAVGYSGGTPASRAPWYRRRAWQIGGGIAAVVVVLGVIGSAVDSGKKENAADSAPLSSPARSSSTAAAPSSAARAAVPSPDKKTTPTKPNEHVQPPAHGGDVLFVMPDETGNVLQDSQDDLQRLAANPIYFSDSKDATGAGRLQILDRDWQVCSQNVSPGTKVTVDVDVVFNVVKTYENCP